MGSHLCSWTTRTGRCRLSNMCGQSIYDEHSKYVLNIKQGRAQKTFKMRAVYEHYVSHICFITCITYIIQHIRLLHVRETFKMYSSLHPHKSCTSLASVLPVSCISSRCLHGKVMRHMLKIF
jgi:hypothetical protein